MTVNGAPYLVENLPGLWVTVDNGGETPLPSANDGGAGVLTQSRRRSRLDNSKSALWSGFSLASLRPTSGSAHTTNDLTAVALRVRGMWSGALVDWKVTHCGLCVCPSSASGDSCVAMPLGVQCAQACGYNVWITVSSSRRQHRRRFLFMRRDGHFGMRPTVPPSVSSQNVHLVRVSGGLEWAVRGASPVRRDRQTPQRSPAHSAAPWRGINQSARTV